MIEIDSTSLLVTADTDHSLAFLEEKLADEGYTLNYFVPPDNSTLLADALSRRAPNLYAEAFGGIDDLCLQIRLSQASGALYTNVKTPRSAAGPSLKKMAIGARDWMGIPIQATLRIFPKPSHREYRVLAFTGEREFEAFEKALVRLRRSFPLRARLRSEAAMPILEGVALIDCLLVLAWWGSEAAMAAQDSALGALIAERQARVVDLKAGKDVSVLHSLLEQAAAQAQAAVQEQAAEGLSHSHRELEAFLKEGA